MSLEIEIISLRREIASLFDRIEELDEQLRPVTITELAIKGRIRDTHDPEPFSFDGAEERRPLFSQLTEIALEYGPVKAERAELKSRLSAYVKRLKALENELEREKKRAKNSTEEKLL